MNSIVNEDDDNVDDVCLSSDTLIALNQFYQESAASNLNLKHVNKFNENWELSQFWYDLKTSKYLAEQVINSINKNGRVALISCPTLYIHLHQMKSNDNVLANVSLTLFEYDSRFDVYDGFVFYDYRDPLSVCNGFEKASFDLVVVDPPFLSEECLEKVAQTVLFLTKKKIILNTGLVMEELAAKYLGLKRWSHFIPRHQNNVGNEFACFTNFEPI